MSHVGAGGEKTDALPLPGSIQILPIQVVPLSAFGRRENTEENLIFFYL